MLLTLLLSVAMLSGCGSKGPTAEDAQAYVKAVLDLMCLGDYDHSVDLADVEEGSETAVRDDVITEMVEQVSANANLDDDIKAEFTQLMIDAFGKAKYTVGEATPTDDGGFDVPVTIEPLRIFGVSDEEFENAVSEKVQANAEEVMAMSETEQTNFVMKILLELMRKTIENPQYDEPQEVVVHYGVIDDEGNYGCSKEDGEAMGAKLFSAEGL